MSKRKLTDEPSIVFVEHYKSMEDLDCREPGTSAKKWDSSYINYEDIPLEKIMRVLESVVRDEHTTLEFLRSWRNQEVGEGEHRVFVSELISEYEWMILHSQSALRLLGARDNIKRYELMSCLKSISKGYDTARWISEKCINNPSVYEALLILVSTQKINDEGTIISVDDSMSKADTLFTEALSLFSLRCTGDHSEADNQSINSMHTTDSDPYKWLTDFLIGSAGGSMDEEL